MADLAPGELAKIDQIHAAITTKLAELVSSAVDGIHAEGEAMTASALAGTAQGTDHNSVSALLAAALVRLARHQIADEKRRTLGEPVRTETGYESRHQDNTDAVDDYSYSGRDDEHGSVEQFAIESAIRHHNDPDYPYAYSIVVEYTEQTYRTAERVILELGTKPEATP